jgi:hypothetical protein
MTQVNTMAFGEYGERFRHGAAQQPLIVVFAS